MKIQQRYWSEAAGWTAEATEGPPLSAQWVLAFGAAPILRQQGLAAALRMEYPNACVFGCSTAGEICGTRVLDDTLVVTAVQLEHTQIRSAQVDLLQSAESFAAGRQMARQLPASVRDPVSGSYEPLVHVLVLTDGLKVNGSEFVAGLMKHLPAGITATGGMAGDGVRFVETLVFRNGAPAVGTTAAVGLYGSRLKVGFGSLGGWDSFGPERLITRSEGNVLYELDGLPALRQYKKYLGGAAQGLPAAGLLFPLSIWTQADDAPVVRTILSVNEEAQSITFAGDVPEGAYARLMKANFERLVDGAAGAARICQEALPSSAPELAILISCVGRRLVLKERIEEEVLAVRGILGGQAKLAGFYSYGEISPFTPGARCELHNQTMTITTLSER